MEPKKYLQEEIFLDQKWIEKNMYDLGIKYGNDKITHHRYDLIYPMFLSRFNDKIIYNIIEEPLQEDLDVVSKLYDVSSNKFYQRDAYEKDVIKKFLEKHCNDDDIIIWSDLDEVPNPEVKVQIETPPPPPPPPPVDALLGPGVGVEPPPAPAPPAPIATTSTQTAEGQQFQVPLAVKHWTTAT